MSTPGLSSQDAYEKWTDVRAVPSRLTPLASISASTLVTWLQQSAAEAGAPPVDWATNQDGGGSSQLYVKNLGQVISTGRLVNNHLGVYAWMARRRR